MSRNHCCLSKLSLIIFGIMILVCTQTFAVTYYVDGSMGNDDQSGTSLGEPFRTIQKAADIMQPGDTCVIRSGTYRETITMNKSGTIDAPLMFKSYRNENVRVTGTIEAMHWTGPEENGIYHTSLALNLPAENLQVFINKKMVHQAREPEISSHDDPFSQTWLSMEKMGIPADSQSTSIYLKTTNGNYFKAKNGGGSEVEATAPTANGWEQFLLIDINEGDLESGDRVGFITNDGKHYLTAENGGSTGGDDTHRLVANRTAFANWEQFTINKVNGSGVINSGDEITLRAHQGGYVGPGQSDSGCINGPILANGSDVNDCTIIVYEEVFRRIEVTVTPSDPNPEQDLRDIIEAEPDAWAGSYIWGRFCDPKEFGVEGCWALNMAKVTSSVQQTLTISEEDDWWDLWRIGEGVIIGGLAALDTENEWHYVSSESTNTGILYLKPPSGSHPDNLNVEVRNNTWVLNITGSHIAFKDIDFDAGQIRIIGNHNTLDSVSVRYGTHFVFRPDFRQSFPDDGVEKGNNGVYIAGDYNTVKNSEVAYSAGSAIVMRGNNNEVLNCLVHDFGYMGTYTSGVYFSGEYSNDGVLVPAKNSKLTRSTLFNSGRDVLHLWECDACEIEYNHLLGPALLSNDSAVVYTFGRDIGLTEISYNWIHGIPDVEILDCDKTPSRLVLGVYLDNGSRNALVHHNVIWDLNTKPGVGPNTPHEGHHLYNNTIIHNKALHKDGSVCQFDRTGENAFCSCGFDANPALKPNFYFEGIGECKHEYNEEGKVTSSSCTNPNNDFYWQSKLSTLANNLYFYPLDPPENELTNPVVEINSNNGWEIINEPDFRPKSRTTLDGAYEYDDDNCIPGYKPVSRNVTDRGVPINRVVSLRSRANDRYVAADLNINSDAPLYANRDWVRRWEQFLIEDAGGCYIALKSLATNKYVSADFSEYGGKLVANRDAIGNWEQFVWINNDDGSVSLRSKENAKYVVAESEGSKQLIPDREWIRRWEKFTATEAPIGNTVSLKAMANGRNIAADLNINTDAPLYANRDWVRKWEKFRVEDAGDGYIALKAFATDKYVAADFSAYNGKLVANRDIIGDWERFYWVTNDDGTVSLIAKKNGRYVVSPAFGQDQLVANSKVVGAEEKFLITKQ